VRVVFLTHNFPRFTGDVSGNFLVPLVHGLRRRGIDVVVVAPADAGDVGAEEFEGIQVRRVRYAQPENETLAYRGTMMDALRLQGGARALFGLWRSLRRAARTEVRAGAQVVHAHWWVPGGLAAPRGVPLVLTMHGTDARLLERSGVARLLARRVVGRAGVVTTVSKPLAAIVQARLGLFIDPSRIQPMPVPLEDERWTSGGAGLMTVSRLTAQKRVHLSLETVACLRDLDIRLPLTVVGEGPERSRLERLASDLGIAPQVTFAGALSRAQVLERLTQADLMLFPAESEGFGLVAAEALMRGVPVVGCWDGGGVLDVVPEQGAGRLVLPSPEAMADAVIGLLRDPATGDRAKAAGEQWRLRLSPDRVAEACEAWYREALDAA
jgi:glycosyltransferase involved in cell wall biosynthesis